MATLALYFPVVHHDFANLDDAGYVYGNPHVQAGLTWRTLGWALLSVDQSNWHPLTWLAHALDCEMFDIDPAGHHAVNVVWHALDAVVLFWVLLLATDRLGCSFMTAALFAVHPINVEAVAWIAERKTVLATFFFLLALAAYRWYVQRPGQLRYLLVAALFIMGLMSKPQVITLPFVLLLWDYWPLRRMFARGSTEGGPAAFPPRSFRWLVEEKLPLFFLCALSALITMKAQGVGRPRPWDYPLWIRMGNAAVAYVRYIGKALWPSHLAVMYLHPGTALELWQVAASALLLLAITALVLAARRYRYLPVGWFWFLGTLVPTIGLIQVGWQAMADRYAYQSFPGLFILACWGLADWARQRHVSRTVLPALSVAVLLALAAVTHHQIANWGDDLTLWSHALELGSKDWLAEDMVGGVLLHRGQPEDAMRHYRTAVAIYPADWRSNLAIAVYEQGRGNLPEAISRYRHALANMDDPLEKSRAYQNLAVAYRDSGDLATANDCLRQATMLRGPQ
ncbi:MAG TPA: hypothetical protein VL240_10770 [Candidatus Binatia bacterium]|nr:hypothetical protein [Candidatus Binatia bacterium]